MKIRLTLIVFLFIFFFAFSSAIDPNDEPAYQYLQNPFFRYFNLGYGGQASVSEYSGAATYRYDFKVPQGTRGLTPDLFIYYNSHGVKSASGVMASGWTLSENYIQRDINNTPLDLSDDKFMLSLSGATHELVYDITDGRYHTKVESYLYVDNLTGGENSEDTYWMVKTSDGTKYRLGYFNHSELFSDNINTSFKWSLDKVTDVYNNSIIYNYTEDLGSGDSGTVYLNRIEYNNEKSREIELIYEDSNRPDQRRSLSEGIDKRLTRRLKRINILLNDSLIRRYELEYSNLSHSPSLSFLSNITEYGSDNSTSLPPVSFGYNEFNTGWTGTSSFEPTYCFLDRYERSTGLRIIDVNGDGLDDLVRGEADGEYGGTCSSGVWINDGNGFVGSSTYQLPGCLTGSTGRDFGYRFVDLNGDGLVDIIRGKSDLDTSCSDPDYGTWINDGTNWVSAPSTWGEYCFIGFYGRDFGYRFVDLNGDGLTDLKRGVGPYANPVDCESGTHNTWLNNGTHMISQSSDAWSKICFVGSTGRDFGYRFGEFNGDGLTDLAFGRELEYSCSGNYGISLNNGSDFVGSSFNGPGCILDYYHRDNGIRLVDVNGDGLTDIISGKGSDSWCSTAGAQVSINNGIGFSPSSWGSLNWCPTDDSHKDTGKRFGEFNGDGKIDMMWGKEDNDWNCHDSYKATSLNNLGATFLLSEVNTSEGAREVFSYVSSTTLNNSGNDSVEDLGFALFVVSNITKFDGMGNNHTIYYDYSGGFYDSEDKDFRGFNFFEKIISDKITQDWYHQSDELNGKKYQSKILEENDILKQSNLEWSFENQSGYFIVALSESSEVDFYNESNKTKVVEYAYDEFGNVIYIHDKKDVTDNLDDSFVYNEYLNNSASWIVSSIKKTYTLDSDNSTKLRGLNYSYDGQAYGLYPIKGAVTQQRVWNNNGEDIVAESGYDSYGNVLNETDANGNVIYYEYESTNTYLDKKVDSMGFVEEYSYDLGLGKVLWVKDSNGNFLNYTYDVLGRPSSEVMVYDSQVYPTKNYTYEFDGVAPEQIKVSIREENGTGNTFDEYQFLDGFGKTIQTKKDAEDNKQIVIDTYYDEFGRVENLSNPYFTTHTTNYSSPDSNVSKLRYTYDILDRVKTQINPDGTSVTNNYGLWEVSSYDENGNRIDRVFNADGKIITIREYNNGEIYNTTYTYDTLGNLFSITDNEGNNWNYTYDSLGRQTSLDDPDVGLLNYTYDANGNLVGQISGSGNLVTGDGYYREYNELGQLVRIRSGDNESGEIFEEYFYDHEGIRVKTYNHEKNETVYTPFKEMMVIVNSSGTFNYTYVYADDVLVAKINPDGSKWYYHPDHLGSTSLITDENGSVVEDTVYYPYGGVLDGGTSEVKLYEGKELDDTGMYYYNARYYSPEFRLFVQPDTMLPDVYDPQQLNRYMFERGNPYVYTDPSGHWVFYVGGISSGGMGAGYTSSAGLAIAYGSKGFEFGAYKRPGIGVVTPTISAGLEVGLAPFQDNLGDFEGKTKDLGGDGGEGVSVGGGVSTPQDDEGFNGKNSAIEVTFQLDLNANLPPYSAYATESRTTVYYIVGGENTPSDEVSSASGTTYYNSNTNDQGSCSINNERRFDRVGSEKN